VLSCSEGKRQSGRRFALARGIPCYPCHTPP
jgi:hypothetical protein